jgi:rod shape-determining protein MreD
MIDVLNRPVVRLVLVGLVALSLQTTLFADMTVRGVVLQIMLCLSVSAGVSGGPERGAFVGFLFGSMFDLVLSTPLGLTALVYGLAGFVAGYVNTLTVNHPWWLGSIVVSVSTAFATFVHPVFASWVGVDGWLTVRVVQIALVGALANAILAPLAVPLMRWSLVIKRRERMAPPPEIFT